MKNALDYLIGEKLFTFVTTSEQDSDFAAELPAFVTAIRRLFAPGEICEFLNHLEQKSVGLRQSRKWIMERMEMMKRRNLWPAKPERGAEELLCFSRIRQLLQP